MYYKNRAEAGRQLAQQLKKYNSKNISVVALSPGGLIIGAQIAMALHSHLVLLLMKETDEFSVVSSAVFNSSLSNFSYNDMYTPGQVEELAGHRIPLIQQKILSHTNHRHTLLGKIGEVNHDLLRRKILIVVSDGFPTGYSLRELLSYISDVQVKKVIVVSPVASVDAVDVMHGYADEIHCPSVTENFISVNHYYNDNTIPPAEDMFKVTKNIALQWKL